MQAPKTHFGFRRVDRAEKSQLVGDVFDSVAEHYDLMNDLMSFGLHRVWKRVAVMACGLRPSLQVLDLAGGSGDMAVRIRPLLGADGSVTVADINAAMLSKGQKRLYDAGYADVPMVRCDAECLPFASNCFDCVVIAFGLRNVSSMAAALEAILRVLKPGGRLVVLEFSQAQPCLQACYQWYSFNVIPKLGKYVAKDEASYRYLVESICMHPNQNALAEMIAQAGFGRSEVYNLCGGVVAIHRAYKP